MICKKCGADNPDYYIFCQNCFSDLAEEERPVQPSQEEMEPVDPRMDSYAQDELNGGLDDDVVEKQIYRPTRPERRAETHADRFASDIDASDNEKTQRVSRPRGKTLGNPDEPYLREPGYQPIRRKRRPAEPPVHRAQETKKRPIQPVPFEREEEDDPFYDTRFSQYAQKREEPDEQYVQSRQPSRREVEPPPQPKQTEERPLRRKPSQAIEREEIAEEKPIRPQKNRVAPRQEEPMLEDELDEKGFDEIEFESAKARRRRRTKQPNHPRKKETPPVKASKDDLTLMGEDMEQPEKKEPNLSARKMKQLQKQAEREAIELKKLQDNQGTDYYDYYDYYDEAATKGSKGRSRVVPIVILIILLLVLGGVAFFGYRFATANYGSVGTAFNAIFKGEDTPITVEESVAPGGVPAHTIMLPVKAGDTIAFRDESLDQTPSKQIAKSERVPVQIPDLAMIPAAPNPDEAMIAVAPSIVRISANGTETPYNIPPYNIEVPQVMLQLTSPLQVDGILVTEPYVHIVGQAYAQDSNAQILINNEIEPELDANGAFAVDVPVLPGDFSIEIKAHASQYRTNIIVLRGTMQIGVDGNAMAVFDEDYEAQVTTSSAMTIKGRTMPNSSLSIPGAQDLQYDATTGAFSFKAPMLTIGRHEFTLTLPSGESQTLKLTRTPNVDEFWQVATELNYDGAIASPEDSRKKSVRFLATVEAADEAALPTPTYQMALRSDPSKKILVHYLGVTRPAVGDAVYVFGDIQNVNPEDVTPIIVEAYFFYSEAVMQAGNQ